jgi:hypothetical protein
LIPAALLLILLTAFGCGNGDSIFSPLSPNSDTLGEIKSSEAVFAAPTDSALRKQASGVIGPEGGEIKVSGCATATFPAGALDVDTYITVEVEIDHYNGKIHYVFGPHGTVFNLPVRLEMNWGVLNNYDGDKNLWYLLSEVQTMDLETNLVTLGYSDWEIDDENQLWVIEDTTIEEATSSFIVYVDHFSEYYYPRR